MPINKHLTKIYRRHYVLVNMTEIEKNLQKELTPIVISFLEACYNSIPEQPYKSFMAGALQIAKIPGTDASGPEIRTT